MSGCLRTNHIIAYFIGGAFAFMNFSAPQNKA